MHLGSPSIRYAKALMEYALERNTENILYEEFSILAYILKTNRDQLPGMILHPKILFVR